MSSPEIQRNAPAEGDKDLKQRIKMAVEKTEKNLSFQMPKDSRIAKYEEKELSKLQKKLNESLGRIEALPDSDDKIRLIEAISGIATQQYDLIYRKFAMIRGLWEQCETKVAYLENVFKGSVKDVANTSGTVDTVTGLNKQAIEAADGEIDHIRSLLDVQLSILRQLKAGQFDELVSEVPTLSQKVAVSQTDYSGAQKAYEAVKSRMDNVETSIRTIDAAVATLSRGVPLGAEVYAGMRSAGLLLGGEDPEKVQKELVNSYAEARFGVAGRAAAEILRDPDLIEHVAAIISATDEALALAAEYIDPSGLPTFLETLEANKRQIATNLVEAYVRLKHPKLSALSTVVKSLLEGKSAQQSLKNGKTDLVRAATKNGKLARQSTAVGVGAATDSLKTVDQRVAEFKQKLKEQTGGKLTPETYHLLEQAAVELMQKTK